MILLETILSEIRVNQVIGQRNLYISKVIKASNLNNDRSALMWVSHKNKDLLNFLLTGIIICNEAPKTVNSQCTYLIVDNPRMIFMNILNKFYVKEHQFTISTSAFIDETVTIGKNVYIGENVVLESNVIIGDNVFIDHNTVLKEGTIVSKGCKIGSNCVIGGVGFGYEKDENGEYMLIPHIGNVILDEDVEIGNNTCVDRAVIGSTILHKNVKLDNLVHIAHGVEIGQNSLIIANSMVAGSVTIGENVWVAPSSSIINGKKIGNNAIIGLSAVVLKDVDANQIIIGNPGKPLETKDKS